MSNVGGGLCVVFSAKLWLFLYVGLLAVYRSRPHRTVRSSREGKHLAVSPACSLLKTAFTRRSSIFPRCDLELSFLQYGRCTILTRQPRTQLSHLARYHPGRGLNAQDRLNKRASLRAPIPLSYFPGPPSYFGFSLTRRYGKNTDRSERWR